MVCYSAVGSLKPKNIPNSISPWFKKFGGWGEKSIMILERTLPLSTDDSFQPPVSGLLSSLHGFFRMYTLEAASFEFDWCPEPEEAYGGFLSLLTDAINGLRVYDSVTNGPDPTSTSAQAIMLPNDDAVAHHRNSLDLHRASITSTGYHHSKHPSCTNYIAERRPEKRMRPPSPRPSKRIKLDNH